MKKHADIPLIYNLFPRHFPKIQDWESLLPKIKKMNFNTVFVNPFHETGFSGSLYAIKNYYRLNPLFLGDGNDPADFSPLSAFIKACDKAGLKLIMDLVINHTAFDADLTKEHPLWYKHDESGKLMNPFAVDSASPSGVTVWGDLAIIDNEESTDKENLWNYWDSLIAFYQKLGILGFRCDAAYQVPASLWKSIIPSAKKRNESTTFYAETLGCSPQEIEVLANVGFDYLFNSSKWWDFDKSWALEQHESNRSIASSISFPESHDTERLAAGSPGTIDVQKCRYAFAALFSKGILMPMGYEYGATTKMDVVSGKPEDVDSGQWDLTDWIGKINALKLEIPVLGEEGSWQPLSEYMLPYLFLKKSSTDGKPSIFVCVNKQHDRAVMIEEWMIPSEIKRCTMVYSLLSEAIVPEPLPFAFELEPADIVLFTQ